MRRGTTPTLRFTTSISIEDYTSIWLTFRTATQELTLGKDRMAFSDATHFAVTLTQEETLRLSGTAQVQVRAATEEGVAVASTVGEVTFEPILKEGIIA